MTFRSRVVSLTGKSHKDNKDSCWSDDGDGLYIVSDGVGTTKPSEVASQAAVQAAVQALSGPAPSDDLALRSWLGQAVQKANNAVRDLARSSPDLKGIGTTLTALKFRAGGYALAHVGDSRIYHLPAAGLRQLTADHTVVYEMVLSGAIKKEWMRDHPDRNLLTRAVGTGEFVAPDIAFGAAAPGDRFLVCSDGVTQELDDAELAAALAPGVGLDEACARMTELSLMRGCLDDMTAIVVEVF